MINENSKVSAYEINIQKFVLFPNTNNKKSETEMKYIEENIGSKILDISLRNVFVNSTPMAREAKQK